VRVAQGYAHVQGAQTEGREEQGMCRRGSEEGKGSGRGEGLADAQCKSIWRDWLSWGLAKRPIGSKGERGRVRAWCSRVMRHSAAARETNPLVSCTHHAPEPEGEERGQHVPRGGAHYSRRGKTHAKTILLMVASRSGLRSGLVR